MNEYTVVTNASVWGDEHVTLSIPEEEDVKKWAVESTQELLDEKVRHLQDKIKELTAQINHLEQKKVQQENEFRELSQILKNDFTQFCRNELKTSLEPLIRWTNVYAANHQKVEHETNSGTHWWQRIFLRK